MKDVITMRTIRRRQITVLVYGTAAEIQNINQPAAASLQTFFPHPNDNTSLILSVRLPHRAFGTRLGALVFAVFMSADLATVVLSVSLHSRTLKLASPMKLEHEREVESH